MYTSGREHRFLFYDFKMAEDFRGRSNKCNLVNVKIKECDLGGCHSSTSTENSMGWIWYAIRHPSSVLHKITWLLWSSCFCATVSSCIKTINRMENDARLLCTTNHSQHNLYKIKLLQVGCDQWTQWTKKSSALFTVRLVLWNPSSFLYCFVLAGVQALCWSSKSLQHCDEQPKQPYIYTTCQCDGLKMTEVAIISIFNNGSHSCMWKVSIIVMNQQRIISAVPLSSLKLYRMFQVFVCAFHIYCRSSMS